MEINFLPEEKGYKANLHSHTTDSDGRLTPEQAKEFYKRHGYTILGYTDHFYMRDRSSLCDENFVAISGYETQILENKPLINGEPDITSREYHINYYSYAPDKVGMVGVIKGGVDWWMRNMPDWQKNMSPVQKYCENEYNIKGVNEAIKQGNDAGYLVCLNHPTWSIQHGSDWLGLKGLMGMEIINYGCIAEGYEDENSHCYDDMLRDGQKLWCLANDDNHNGAIFDSFGGYNIMYPEKLTYTDVFNCMKNGKFYASSGATIRGINLVDDKLYVGSDDAEYIYITTNGRYSQRINANGSPLHEAVFHLPLEKIKYFRVTVVNSKGNKAFSHAYFTEDLK